MTDPGLPNANGAAPGASSAAPDSRNSPYGNRAGATHGVPLFPSAADAMREGFVRVINRSDTGGEVNITAIDDAGLRIETPVFGLDGNETAHFNSDDLEQGNAEKGLSGGTGAGTGDWRLELSSDLDIEVLAYIRTQDGFLTAMHDVVERGLAGHRVAIFNPGRNRNQRSLLRLINPGTVQAGVTISGIDDVGLASDATVAISLPAGGAKTISAAALESAAERSGADENGAGWSGVDGALGPGAGKWQLMVTADHPVLVMSLLMSPTGHLTNLSTAPYRSDSGAGRVREVAENTEGGAAIGEPVTADLGTGAELTHVLQGPDAESFAIDESSGQLRAREGVTYDFETRTTYALIVNVTDGAGGVVRIPVTVEVTDADEPPGKPAPPEVEGVSSRSVLVSWEEPENTGPAIADYDVEYRRPGGQEYTDAEHEGIERETGIEHLRAGTDYEFRVRASNEEGTGEWSEPTLGRARSGGGGGGGGGTAPPPNRAPVFQGPSSFTLPENRKEAGTVRASNATTYTIANGGDGAEFQIDNAGALQFQSPPDYERPTDVATSDPPDAARNNTYVVGVEAMNATGSNMLSTIQTFTVTVTDTAFEAPEITSVAVLSSTELSVTWQPRDNAGPPIQDFNLQYKAAGERDFTDSGHRGLSTSATLNDLAPSTEYEIQVRAVNGNGPSQWSASESETTVDNTAPAFTLSSFQRTLTENTDPGEDIGAPLTANDPDRDQLTYRLGGRDASSFDLETDSAQLKTRTGIDYDFERKEQYELTVTAEDGHGGRASANVEVTIVDLTEPPGEVARPTVKASTLNSLTIDWNAPANTGPPISDYDYRYRRDVSGQPWTEVTNTTITTTEVEIGTLMSQTDYRVEVLANNDEGNSGWSLPATGTTADNQAPRFRDGSSTTRRLPENTTGMVDIGTPVSATDGDGGTLEYSLEGPAAGRFGLDMNGGQLRTRTSEVYDHEAAARHDVTVRVVDGQGGSAAIDVAIEVTDLREPPARPDAPRVSTLSSKRLMVRWTVPDNTGPPITDYDYRYRASSGWSTVSNTALTDAEVEIDGLTPDTGYEVQVLATNPEGSSTWSDSGTATTDPNQAPMFAEGATTRRALAENTAAQSDFGAPVAATDGNNDPVTYRLSGTDASRFALDEDSGQLSTRGGFVPNHEDQADYSVTVTARDDQGAETGIDVTVDITDLDEPPNAPSAPTRAGGTSTTLRMTWPAPNNTGPDIEDYDYRYRRQQLPVQNWTEVSNTSIPSPEITLEGLEPDATYEVEARAHNAEGTSSWGATGSGETNQNRAPTFNEGSSTTRNVPENTAGFVDIGNPVAATDRDDDDLTYDLEGTDGVSFRIDPASGQLSTRSLDYDHESKSSYQVTLKVTDMWNGVDTIAVNIHVTDLAEPPLIPDAPDVYGKTPYELQVKWESPGNAGRPDIAGYDVQYRESGMGFYRVAGTFTDTVAAITGLEPETAYQVQVLARNAEGASDWSQPGAGSTLIVVPEVNNVDFDSDPGTDNTYKKDDTIEVAVKFTEDVTVNTTGGTPQIDLVFDTVTLKAEYAAGSSTATELAFEYDVTEDDVDTNGASIRANSLTTNGGTIRKSGVTLDASLLHAGRSDDSGHKVDGKAPALVSAAANGVKLTLIFSEQLATTPAPATDDFTVRVAGADRDVSGVSVSGTMVVLTLDSTVAATDSVTVTYAGTGTNPIRDPAGNPATAFTSESADNVTAGVCGRTAQVRDVLIDKAGVSGCADVTTADLEVMTQLYLGSEGITSLAEGDFDGLTALEWLNLEDNSLSDLPTNIFSELTALTRLDLDGNSFSTLPSVFSGLSELVLLNLDDNQLSDLPGSVFAALTGLQTLWLAKNEFTTLPSNAFADVSTVTWIDLDSNQLASPDGAAFDGLADLERLWLADNRLTGLPDGFFSGLESLEQLDLQANTIDPLPIPVTLSLVAAGQVQASVPIGAPFEIFVPIEVKNGSIAGGATGVTVAQGATQSDSVTISRASGTRAAVTADIGKLPELPDFDIGYTLVRDDGLPLEAVAGTREIVLRPTSLTVREDGSNGYSVALRTPPGETVTVTVTTPTGITADPSPLTFTADDWHRPQTITLEAATDTDTTDNTVAVTHQASGGDYAGLSATLPVTVAETVADTNTAPEFSSADTFTVTEHEAPVGTVIAGDSDTEDSVTGYTPGGADGDLFEVTPDGALRFTTPPDHEKPEDATADNEYIVTVTAASGVGARRRTTDQTITVTVEDVLEPPGRPPAPFVSASTRSSTILFLDPGRRPIHNTGPEITEYNLQAREKDSGPFILQSYNGQKLDLVLTGFESGTTYEIQVRAVNDEGEGDWSPSTEATTPVNQPPRLISSELPSGAEATAGGAVAVFEVDAAFEDSDGEIMRLEVASRDTAIATAAMEGGLVAVTPLTAGQAIIAVTASDPDDNTAEGTFNVSVQTPTVPDLTVSIDSSGDTLTVEFTDDFTAGELRAYDVAIRQKSPRGGWDVFCGILHNNAQTARSLDVSQDLPIGSFSEPGVTYEVVYRYVGTSCTDSSAVWSRVAEVTTPGTSSFDIDLVILGTVSSTHRNTLQRAARRWERILTTSLPDIDFSALQYPANRCQSGQEEITDVVDDLRIYVQLTSIDGEGGTLGAAGVCLYRRSSGLPIVAAIRMDADDLATNSSSENERTMIHEIAHALGFGTRWYEHHLLRYPSLDVFGNLVFPPPDTHFTGALAIAAFDTAGGTAYEDGKVPVQSTGGPGNRDGHWRESVLDHELMTPSLDSGATQPLSAITIQSMADMGYAVDATRAESYTLPTLPSGLVPKRSPAPSAKPENCVVMPGGVAIETGSRTILPADAVRVRGSAPRSAR